EILDPPVWKDTYYVRNGEKTWIRTAYKDFTGDFVLHCHILIHEDQGMMQRVRIEQKVEDRRSSLLVIKGITQCK
ncbi:MAG: multicopper oxidase domain-containing protein, partial [Cyclobacteriaceae bacterium]